MKAKRFRKVLVGTALTVALSAAATNIDIPYNVFSHGSSSVVYASEGMALDLKFESNVNDSSANVLTPVVNGNPEFSQGRIGQAINFTSPGQYVDLGSSNELQFGENADFSIAFWFKSDGINGDPSIISNKNWNSGSNTGWILAVNSANLIWNFKTSE